MGDFAAAASLIAEGDSVAAATGSQFAALRLAAGSGHCKAGKPRPPAMRARSSRPPPAVRARRPPRTGRPRSCTTASARYEEAASAARQATASTCEPGSPCGRCPSWSRRPRATGDTELARDALERLAETTQAAGTDVALGIEARCRALLSDGAAADDLYREAIDRLGRTRLRPELARAHLLYGEWLRREGRRVDAREQLRTAHEMLAAIGMEAFAERARRELVATGETVRKRTRRRPSTS